MASDDVLRHTVDIFDATRRTVTGADGGPGCLRRRHLALRSAKRIMSRRQTRHPRTIPAIAPPLPPRDVGGTIESG